MREFEVILGGLILRLWTTLVDHAASGGPPGGLTSPVRPDRAIEFYRELFGWQPETLAMEAAEMSLWRLPGYVGGEPQQPVPRDVVAVMLPLMNGAGQTSRWSIGLWIDDADAAAAEATELGGRVLVAPHDIPGFRQTVLADPSGATFSVSQLQANAGR